MRKLNWFLTAGLVIGLVVGCGTTSTKSVQSKLQTQQETISTSNYQSEATMTVQMDNGSQTYYIHTSYESPDMYKIELGDANKNINQVIVKNKNGMFVVSPSLQKVFRFNGSWAQNQGQVYLYDQLLKQITTGDNVKVTTKDGMYNIAMPMAQGNDVVTRQEVTVDSKTLYPKQVVLYDKEDKAVVTISYTNFKTSVKYSDSDFDPQKIATSGTSAKTTMASDNGQKFVYVEPENRLGDSLDVLHQDSETSATLRYTGDSPFTLQEFVPDQSVSGFPSGQLVDLYGVPAMFSGINDVHQLTWVHNGVEYSLTSADLNLDQMMSVAVSTFAQVGK